MTIIDPLIIILPLIIINILLMDRFFDVTKYKIQRVDFSFKFYLFFIFFGIFLFLFYRVYRKRNKIKYLERMIFRYESGYPFASKKEYLNNKRRLKLIKLNKIW